MKPMTPAARAALAESEANLEPSDYRTWLAELLATVEAQAMPHPSVLALAMHHVLAPAAAIVLADAAWEDQARKVLGLIQVWRLVAVAAEAEQAVGPQSVHRVDNQPGGNDVAGD